MYRFNTGRRRKHGKGRNEGGFDFAAADLLIIVPLFVVGAFLFCDAILLAVYKFKLCNVAVMAATYASELPPGRDIEARTKAMAQALAMRAELPGNNVQVKICTREFEETEIVEVEVTGKFPLLKNINLPAQVELKEKSAAPLPANQVRAVLGISPYPYAQEESNTKPCVYVPIVRPTRSMPVWSFPVDTSLNYLKVVQGDEPEPTQTKMSDAFFQKPSIY